MSMRFEHSDGTISEHDREHSFCGACCDDAGPITVTISIDRCEIATRDVRSIISADGTFSLAEFMACDALAAQRFEQALCFSEEKPREQIKSPLFVESTQQLMQRIGIAPGGRRKREIAL